MIGDADAEISVGRGLDVGICQGEGARDAAEAGEHRLDVIGRQFGRGLEAEEILEPGLFLHRFGDPLADLAGGHRLFANEGAISLDLVVELVDAVLRLPSTNRLTRVGLGRGCEELCGVVEVVVVEQLSDPRIDVGEDHGFLQVDRSGVVAAIDGVFAAKLAAVVRLVVVPAAFHASAAVAAADQPGEDVVAALKWYPCERRSLSAGEDRFDGVPLLLRDERLVGLFARSDPAGLFVPPHPSLVTERDVVNVDEDLVAPLPIPDLVSEVALVAEDHPHRGVTPAAAVLLPMLVANWVACTRRRDALGREHVGYGVKAVAADVFLVDAAHDGRGQRVRLESVEPLAVRSLTRIGMRARVGESVAVGRAPALEPTFDRDLRFHRGTDAGLDAVPFALAHTAVERHHDLVGVATGVDCTADLGDPQLHSVVNKDGERQPELVPVERALRFADHDAVEVATRVGESLQQPVRLRAARPRERSRLTKVEELLDDLAADGFDQLSSACVLPIA